MTTRREAAMSDVLIVEVHGAKPEKYDEVNGYLGFDPRTGSGDWPDGMRSHVAAATAGGDLVVIEVWDSREQQQQFLESHLGPALGKAGITKPDRMEWLDIVAHQVN
jgi:hypothetical protein